MATINGTTGNDTLTGTADDDVVYAGAGKDTIRSGNGNDVIYGGDGNDWMNGEAGNDTLYGEAGDDTLTGDAGNDLIYGGDGNDGVYGGGNDDVVYGGNGNDTIFGDAANDRLYGEAGNDTISGGSGDDLLDGGSGVNALDGGSGNDTFVVRAGEGSNTIVGGAGTDALQLALTSADLSPALRADLSSLSQWMAQNLAAAGSASALATQTTGPSLAMPSLGLTISTIETVNITLNGSPVSLASLLNTAPSAAAVVAVSTQEDVPVTGNVGAIDAEGDALAYGLQSGPAHGSLSLNAATGEYTYTPGANFNGADTFSVRVSDPGGLSAVQQVNVGIATVNDAPVAAANVSIATSEDVPVTGQVIGSDVDGDVLGFALHAGPAHGSLALNAATGEYTYTPGANFNGADTFSVRVSDAGGLSAVQQVQIAVAAVNDAPVTPAQTMAVTLEDKPLLGLVQGTDVDGDTLTFGVQNGPAHGALSIDSATGLYLYTPTANYSGSDTFSVRVTDPDGSSAVQQISMFINPVADAPVLTTANTTVALSGAVLTGTQAAETLVASAGVTHILGGAGNDTIYAGGAPVAIVPLAITAGLTDLDGSESLVISIHGIPEGATLSAGHPLLNLGVWDLSAGDLAGLTITASTSTDFTLQVVAQSLEQNGRTEWVSSELTVSFDHSSAPSIIEGGSGSDAIFGSLANDVIYGSAMPSGSLKLAGVATDKDNDVIHGGDGNDTIYGQNGNDTIYGEAGNDWLSGGKGNDHLYAGTGKNVIYGNSGNDVIHAEGGDDTVYGGTGFDTLDYSASNHAMTIDVSKHTALGFNTASFNSIEKIIGSSFADSYKGSSGADIFEAGAGNDTIRGLGGADILTGGSGNDTFVYFQKDADAVDHITDFAVGDKLDLHDFLKSAKYGSISDVVHVSDSAAGSTVSVKYGATFVDLVVLDGVHGMTAHDMLAQGMLLS